MSDAHRLTAFLPSSFRGLRASNFRNQSPIVRKHVSLCSVNESKKSAPSTVISRRVFLSTLTAIAATTFTSHSANFVRSENDAKNPGTGRRTPPEVLAATVESSNEPLQLPEQPRTILGHRTPSGIYYVEFNDGIGPTPEWGNLVNIDFILYTVADQTELVEHASSFKEEKFGFLIHHGNGEQILGLEQMVHDMRAGAKRRCVIPSSLGYVRSGMIPIPYSDRKRRRFLEAINKDGGTVVLDLQVNWIKEDPDDRGYYTDLVLPDEEIVDLMKKNRVDEVPPDALSITI